MPRQHRVTIDGSTFLAPEGELLLDAALNAGVALPHDCRAGHCGTCCVRLVSGEVHGGAGAEPGIVHACQCRIVADAAIERRTQSDVRTVDGVVTSLLPLSRDIVEVGIGTERALPHHAGQYAQVRFKGYPSRPFSITHPLRGDPDSGSIWFHIRRMKGGQITPALGKRIKLGHRVTLSGPFGSAHFRPQHGGRLVLVGTNTGFAPIYSIAVAALRENADRRIMVIAGGRSMDALYMGPALGRLARFPNVRVVPVCSDPRVAIEGLYPGRPTDYLPRLLPTDVVYACGAPGMVEAIKSITAMAGSTCHADPFLKTTDGNTIGGRVLARAKGWLAAPGAKSERQVLYDRSRDRGTADPSL
jgi:NAD(P)H-flavin reductase/ferredoxin